MASRVAYHLVAATATAAHVAVTGILLLLVLSARGGESQIIATVLKGAAVTLYGGVGLAAFWFWLERRWAVALLPIVGVALVLAVLFLGRLMIDWSVPISFA